MATMYNKLRTGEHYLSHSMSEVVNLLHLKCGHRVMVVL